MRQNGGSESARELKAVEFLSGRKTSKLYSKTGNPLTTSPWTPINIGRATRIATVTTIQEYRSVPNQIQKEMNGLRDDVKNARTREITEIRSQLKPSPNTR